MYSQYNNNKNKVKNFKGKKYDSLWENLMDFKNSNLASSIRGQTD
jgi:hypothetical protein